MSKISVSKKPNKREAVIISLDESLINDVEERLKTLGIKPTSFRNFSLIREIMEASSRVGIKIIDVGEVYYKMESGFRNSIFSLSGNVDSNYQMKILIGSYITREDESFLEREFNRTHLGLCFYLADIFSFGEGVPRGLKEWVDSKIGQLENTREVYRKALRTDPRISSVRISVQLPFTTTRNGPSYIGFYPTNFNTLIKRYLEAEKVSGLLSILQYHSKQSSVKPTGDETDFFR